MSYMNKYSEATGAFWGASVFIGALVSILLGFKIIGNIGWLPSILIGVCIFLIIGLLLQGIIALAKKENK